MYSQVSSRGKIWVRVADAACSNQRSQQYCRRRRSSSNEFRHFVSIARSSLSELDTQFDLSQQLGFITDKVRLEVDALLIRVDKMLYALRRSIEKP